jgi:predicted cobalt transporter CbtA
MAMAEHDHSDAGGAMAAHDHPAGDAPAAHSHGGGEEELVSRSTQAGLGLFTGVVGYGAAFGGLFALVFAFAYGRIGPASPRAVAAILAAVGFVVVVIVPQLKYPANPPAVGQADTIGFRTGMFWLMLAVSVGAAILATLIQQALKATVGAWNAAIIAGAGFVVIVGAAMLLLPTINEVGADFPAALLWQFRIASLGTQAVLWATIGLLFGALTERSLRRG